MQLSRLAESTVLNNAWIVGVLAACALVATWLLMALSSFLIRKPARRCASRRSMTATRRALRA